MLHYILQTVAFQLFFLLIYDLFLKKETFFNWNRFYLLITAISSIILPFLKFESIRTIVPEQFVIRLPEVIIGEVQPIAANSAIQMSSEIVESSSFIWSWDYVLYTGMLLAGLLFIYKIIKISVLIHKNPKRWKDNLIIVNLLKSNAAFSFFNYVFLGEWIKEAERETILKHELVHVSQKHSVDLLLFEVLRILFWFNPLIYMYQNRMTTLHEYIADAKAVKQSGKKQYYEKLLSQVFDTESISFTNTFFNQSLTRLTVFGKQFSFGFNNGLVKKRIVMLSKSKSHRIHLLKYALLIPMVFGMLAYTSSYAKDESVEESTVIQELSYEELAAKYYKEIIEMAQNGTDRRDIQAKYDMSNDKVAKQKYIKSMDEMARIKAYTQYSAEEFIKTEKAEGTLTEEDKEYVNQVLNRYKTYEDYLAYQKTDEAKSNWESDIYDGELRLVVGDMRNLTDDEKKKKQQKIELIDKDDYFHKLTMTDGSATITTDFGNAPNLEREEIVEYDIEVPFSVIDEVPTVEACKNFATNEEKRQCLSDYISNFVNQNFNTNLGKENGLTGRQRISVMFRIGKDGNIQNVMARAAHPVLEAEAKRVIGELPRFIPGKHKGKAVVVPYSLPILFQVQGSDNAIVPTQQEPSKDTNTEMTEVPFSVVDEAPTFDDCKSVGDQDAIRDCTKNQISDFVNKNFNTKLAKELGLKGPQRISVIFKIGTGGKIFDIKSRAPHPGLEAEAIRVIKGLPQMIPGKHNGENVVVPYSLPILFQVNE